MMRYFLILIFLGFGLSASAQQRNIVDELQQKTVGKGTVTIHTKQGKKEIANVLFVPRLSQNFLSIVQLLHNKYFVTFKNYACTIYNPQGAKIAKVNMVDNMFFFF